MPGFSVVGTLNFDEVFHTQITTEIIAHRAGGNEEDDIEYFMTGCADAIITDSVKLSGDIKAKPTERKPLEIILQKAYSLIQ